MLKWLQKLIDQPQIKCITCVTIVSRTNSYFALTRSVFQDGEWRPFWIWAPTEFAHTFTTGSQAICFKSNFIDDKSIDKTISTLNGHGIVGDDPTNIQELTTGLVFQTMDLYVHWRKWSLTIHGLKGEAGEDEEVTRDACVKPAKIILVPPTLPQPILWLVTAFASRQAAAL